MSLLEDSEYRAPSWSDEVVTLSASGDPLVRGVEDDDAAELDDDEASEDVSSEAVRLGCL